MKCNPWQQAEASFTGMWMMVGEGWFKTTATVAPMLLVGPEAAAPRAFQEVGAAEIAAINRAMGGSGKAINGSVDTIAANMSYREAPLDKVATAIRDIAGRHLFNDGNKRTAQVVAEQLSSKNGMGLNAERIRQATQQVGDRSIRSVEEIAEVLKGK